METLPATVLILENHPIMRTALCEAIAEEEDLTVVEQGTDPTGGVQMVISLRRDAVFLKSKPDIILLAIGKPGLEELETLKALRNFLPDTPILALTSNEVSGQEQAALEAGAQAVLTKAASRSEIIHALRAIRSTNSSTDHREILKQEANTTTSQ
jgi:two-component system nitrate/nitrite response regulator NarL